MQHDKILEVKNLIINFYLKSRLFNAKSTVHAVQDVSFDVYRGETLGIVGESGCGKSSLARALVGLNQITSGEIVVEGISLVNGLKISTRHNLARNIQLVFQDPSAALDPRMTVSEIIAEPLTALNPGIKSRMVFEKVTEIMQMVGLDKQQSNRYPQQLSGGQAQRVGIARALIISPKVLVCDEAVSALDISIKAQIINLLKKLQSELKLSIIFISHDLSIVRHLCDRVLVMYLGHIMELGSNIYTQPLHPYTQAMISALPVADPDYVSDKSVQLLEGELPSPLSPPQGCVFNTRCPKADHECYTKRPPLTDKCGIASVACFKVK